MNQFKVLIDSREKSFQHIIDYFNRKDIPHEVRKLKSGDYSCTYNGELQKVWIERKNSLDELVGNFTTNRKRFVREFERDPNAVKILLIEDSMYADIVKHNYFSKILPQALLASLLTFEFRYNTHVWFVKKEFSGQLIYHLLKYYLHVKESDND